MSSARIITCQDVVAAGACVDGVKQWVAKQGIHAGGRAELRTRFPSNEYIGDGDGDGDGYGYGYGYGYGDGYGDN